MREGIIHENTYISFYLFKVLTSQIFASDLEKMQLKKKN